MSEAIRDSVHSADGTRIAFVTIGHGNPLVIVHGSLATSESWIPVARILANRFTCLVMDRRGYGQSEDHPNFSIEREYEDIEAVLARAGDNVSLLGHSYGAVCALGAATRTLLTHLILYEPPLPVKGSLDAGALHGYDEAIQLGNLDGALSLGLNKFAGVTHQQIEALRRSTLWPKMVALAPTWTREVAALNSLGPSLDRYVNLQTPILLLSGTLSAQHPLQETAHALAATLKNVQVSKLNHQGHNAHVLAPELVAERVATFLKT